MSVSGITLRLEINQMYGDYMRSKYKADERGFVFASEKDGFGVLIKTLLTKPPDNWIDIKTDNDLVFVLSAYTDLRPEYNCYLSANSKKMLRKYIRREFFFLLHDHIQSLNKTGFIEVKTAILNFCEINQIHPDHFIYDSLKREYLRYKKKIRSRKTTNITSVLLAVLSLSCPVLVPCTNILYNYL